MFNKFDALTYAGLGICDAGAAPCGYGVEYDNGDVEDIKDLIELNPYELATHNGSEWVLQSLDGRQETRDEGSRRSGFYYLDPTVYPLGADSDGAFTRGGNRSPAHPALVDSQYYTWITDLYFTTYTTSIW